MKKNTGTQYEQITKQIFSNLFDHDGFKNIKIEHNKILKGITTSHQIDVYWEFSVAGIRYEAIVQAKDWKNKVNKGELQNFSYILNDLPGQPRGIFVTKSGYQKGAKQVANANGILLYELRETNEKDFNDSIKEIVIEINSFAPFIKPISFIQDFEWLKNNIEKPKEIMLEKDILSLILYNSILEPITTFNDYLCNITENKFEEIKPKEITHLFNQDTFIELDGSDIKFIKILGFKALFEIKKYSLVHSYKVQDIVSFILKNLSDNKTDYFNRKCTKL